MNIDSAIDDLIRQHNLAIENLTSKQLGEAIRQAIVCGDFRRLIVAGSGRTPIHDYFPVLNPTHVPTSFESSHTQCIVYMPFAELGKLQRRVDYLTDLLKEHGIAPDPEFRPL